MVSFCYRLQNNSKGTVCTVIKLKGDGKKISIQRMKATSGDYYPKSSALFTSGEWQEIEIPIKDIKILCSEEEDYKPDLKISY
jgi:hypothetical protein